MATARIDDFTKEIIPDDAKVIQLTVGGSTYDFASVKSLIGWIKANLAEDGAFRDEDIEISVKSRRVAS